jgi:hypothetical protein
MKKSSIPLIFFLHYIKKTTCRQEEEWLELHNSQKRHMRFGNNAKNAASAARIVDLMSGKCYNKTNYKLMKNFFRKE